MDRTEGRLDVFWAGFVAGAAVGGLVGGLVASQVGRRAAARVDRVARELAHRFHIRSGNGQPSTASAEASLEDSEHRS